jgi:WD40 repeat protein
MEYFNLDLEIRSGSGGAYPVRVQTHDGRVIQSQMRFPSSEWEMAKRLKDTEATQPNPTLHRQPLSSRERAMQTFGERLFEGLMTGAVGITYNVSLNLARREKKGLRLRLHLSAPELSSMPWEYLYDPGERGYLCLSEETPIVRLPDTADPFKPLEVTLPLRILVVAASPIDQDALDLEEEKRVLNEKLGPLIQSGIVRLRWSESTWEMLQHHCQRDWHIFHFIGHGTFHEQTGEGILALEDERRRTKRVRASVLADLLKNIPSLRLAVLEACQGARGSEQDIFSSLAATLIQKQIPAVLAMQYDITDRSARAFAGTFYDALAAGKPVDGAAAQARIAIRQETPHTLEWGTPVLYLRSSGGKLFEGLGKMTSESGLVVVEPPPDKTSVPPKRRITRRQALVGLGVTGIALGTGTVLLVELGPKPKPLSWDGVYRGHTDLVRSVAWSPDGTRIASASNDRTVQVWDSRTGKPLLTYRMHQDQVLAVSWSPDGRRIVSASKDGTAQVWDASSGQKLLTYTTHRGQVYTAAWSPRGGMIASGGDIADQTVQIWNDMTGDRLYTYTGYSGFIGDAEWSPDGQRIASGGGGFQSFGIQIWDALTGNNVVNCVGHTDSVFAVAWSPHDGKRLVSASNDKTLRMWDALTGAFLFSYPGHQGFVYGVSWSSTDNRRIASCSADNTVQIWDAITRSTLYTYRGHTRQVHAVAWSPDGMQLASGSTDTTVHIWKPA